MPDIEGDEGYPRIHQLNYEEVKDKQTKENEFIANALTKQIESSRVRKEYINKQEAENDRNYLSGWGYRKDIQG